MKDKNDMKRSRGIPYFDNIDLEILEFLNIPNHSENSIGWSVLSLVDKLKITHISLKKHIDKLLRLKLICVDNRQDKIFLITIKEMNEDLIFEELSNEQKKKIVNENTNFKIILNYLQQIKKLHYEKEQGELLDIDLRKTETQDRFKSKTKISKK